MAHERLATSMRENAEALAEAMILEERHTLQKRIIFQTLQEGLSIGIKHGYGALNRFRILINSDQEAIRIQLIHLGHAHPLEDIGFGLHAAAEHVSLLGGTIEAESEAGGFS